MGWECLLIPYQTKYKDSVGIYVQIFSIYLPAGNYPSSDKEETCVIDFFFSGMFIKTIHRGGKIFRGDSFGKESICC